ncbi:MAG: hypothetical protein ABI415_07550 [Flavitalea sp.]
MKLVLLIAGFCITIGSYAQDCTGYYFLQNNKTVEMTVYGKKHEVSAKQVYKVSDVKTSGGTTSGHLDSEMFDKNGKSISKSSSIIKCDGGIMMIDMKMTMPMNPTQKVETDVKADNIFIEYPTSMKVGDQLKDATMHLDMASGNNLQQSIDMEVNDRKVESKEKVTTSAGSWDCFKITYHAKMKIKTMGIGIPMNIDGVEYFAPGFGIVKTESPHGGTEITSIK